MIQNKCLLLDAYHNIIVVFNLKVCHVEVMISLPIVDLFGNEDCFVSFEQYGNDLILLSNYRNYLLRVSLESGVSSLLKTEHSFCFWIINGTHIFYISCATELGEYRDITLKHKRHGW